RRGEDGGDPPEGGGRASRLPLLPGFLRGGALVELLSRPSDPVRGRSGGGGARARADGGGRRELPELLSAPSPGAAPVLDGRGHPAQLATRVLGARSGAPRRHLHRRIF